MLNETYTNGVLVASNPAPGLGVNRSTIPADNATAATLHYRRQLATETTATITVNGAVSSLALDANGDVQFQVTAPQAGVINITVNNDSTTLQAI